MVLSGAKQTVANAQGAINAQKGSQRKSHLKAEPPTFGRHALLGTYVGKPHLCIVAPSAI